MSMYLEHFHLNKSPFSEEPDPDVFFPEAGRNDVINGLCADIVAGKPLIKVIGSEGSGKTMLCRRLLVELDDSRFEKVYIDNPVGSFDDLLHLACLDLGMEPATVPDRDMLTELRALLAAKKELGKEVVLVVDEAEKIFLAALERLMRALCEAGETHLLHVVLVGRPSLEANLEQLTFYCSDVDIKSGYSLQSLTAEETAGYLNFRLVDAGLPQDSREEIFTDGAVQKIFESAHGNIRLVNILAEEALQASCTDKSFLVLLDHVDEQGAAVPGKGIARVVPSALLGKKILYVAGGLLAVILLLVFLFAGGGEKEIEDIVNIPGRHVETVAAPESRELVPEQIEPPPETAEPVSIKEPAVVAEEPQPQQEAPQLEPPQTIELLPDRVKVAPTESQAVEESTPGSEIQAVKPVEPVAAVTADTGNRNGEQLFRERIRASAKWLASAYHNRYTVQLMMLASEQAAPNLKKMFVQNDYYAIKDNLYVLTKKTSPPTLFVFYGTYDSMEQARQARNNMPLFLRKHHPYALSINDAMKKTED